MVTDQLEKGQVGQNRVQGLHNILFEKVAGVVERGRVNVARSSSPMHLDSNTPKIKIEETD